MTAVSVPMLLPCPPHVAEVLHIDAVCLRCGTTAREDGRYWTFPEFERDTRNALSPSLWVKELR